MEYIVVEAVDINSLASIVQKHIDNGYRPCGGISSVKGNGYMPRVYIQAMTKE